MPGGVFSTANLFGMTIRESANDGSDFTNPDADYRRLFLGEDGLLHLKDSAGTVTTPSASSGAVTSSGLTMATARLLGRTTASTGAIEEITVGTGLSLSAGSLTASGSSAPIASGTSFPGSPSTDDLFLRTDRDLLYFYDGTRWLTLNLYREYLGGGSPTVSAVIGRLPVWTTTDMWLDSFWVSYALGATNNGSNYWTFRLRKIDSAISATNLVDIATNADSGSTYYNKTGSIGALLGSFVVLDWQALITAGAPSTPGIGASVSYRLVG